MHAEYSRDGRSIVSVRQRTTDTGVLQLVDAATLSVQASVAVPFRGPGFLYALSADHTRLAWMYNSAGETHTDVNRPFIRVYDLTTGTELHLIDHYLTLGDRQTGMIQWSASFSPDGRRLATAVINALGGIDTAFVFDLTDANAPPALADRTATSVEFDPTGRYLALGHQLDGGLTVVDAHTLAEIAAPRTGHSTMMSIADPTGQLLLSDATCAVPGKNEPEGLLVLWDTTSFREIGLPFAVSCGFWFPDGSRFGGYDATHIRIYETRQSSWLDIACRFAGRDLTEDEWQQYGPAKPYRKTCSDRS
jgi:hypothetical protein